MIIHVDMDAFYASVEIRDRPELRNQPVVVGGAPTGRGVVSAANYVARQFGIHSAMPASQVLKLCPSTVFIRPRMRHYSEISQQIRDVFNDYTPLVEPLSLDEAFLDVSGSEKLFGQATQIAREIKDRILRETGLIASAGVAPNKYLAKVASDIKKPDGFVVVDQANVMDFLEPLPVRRIWGVGKKCEARLADLGIRTIGQLRQFSLTQLEPLFGTNSQHFWNLARGIDNRRVIPDRNAKSISHETTFPVDIVCEEILEAKSMELSEQVARRLRRYEIKCGTVQLKIRYSDFHTITRASKLAESTDITSEISEEALTLIRRERQKTREPVRLLGIGVSNLLRPEKVQRLLFMEQDKEKKRHLDETTDQIIEKFGEQAVSLGKVFELKKKTRKSPDEKR